MPLFDHHRHQHFIHHVLVRCGGRSSELRILWLLGGTMGADRPIVDLRHGLVSAGLHPHLACDFNPLPDGVSAPRKNCLELKQAVSVCRPTVLAQSETGSADNVGPMPHIYHSPAGRGRTRKRRAHVRITWCKINQRPTFG